MPSSVDVLEVPVQALTRHELLDEILRRIEARVTTTVMYANVHVVNTARREPTLLAALRGADIVYCDGDGVRLGAWLLAEHLPERITGAELVWDLASSLARHGRSIYWIGGAPGVAANALARLAEHAPGLSRAGAHDGFFAKDGAETDAVIDAVNAAAPDLVVVGMGTPIQELWVAQHRARIAAPIVWCIGATADFITGVQVRAPAFMTRHGLEWLHRLARDPRRMFGRYVVGNPLFLARILRARYQKERG